MECKNIVSLFLGYIRCQRNIMDFEQIFCLPQEEHDGTVDGCYNTLCSGFVVTNPNIPIDTAFNDVSIAQRSQVFQWMMVTLV